MDFSTLMKIGDNIDADASLADRALVGGQVVLIGMGVVFGVLILLIGILQLFKLFSVKKSDAPASAPAPTSSPAPAPVASVQPAVAASSSDEEKIVAVASAAIAAARGESECNFNIVSIKKIVK